MRLERLQTSDDCYVIVGSSCSNDGDVSYNNGQEDYWVIKIGSDGNLIWEKSLGGSASDIAKSSRFTSDGGIIVAGSSRSDNGDVSDKYGLSDYWIV